MDFEEFQEKFNEVLRTGDELLLVEIKNKLTSNSEPGCYMFIANLHEPEEGLLVDGELIKKEIKEKFTDVVEEMYYKKLAFENCKKRAESGEYDYMSTLAELYVRGEGTEKNEKQAEYWLDKLYIEREGITYKEWLTKNA